ncbi:ribose-phosphate diphosphokinase [candidate division CSSED10-310 bacterium]|uniref:Ribose-phosphate pyrophosphokinase n=1 Tax=candidate division CSSED10-310 bacterium TaxID=2855610 RepID=A0ABV6YUT9_UNCC1
MPNNLKIFAGRANEKLCSDISDYLNIELSDIEITTFSDGEVYVQVKENVRGEDVFVVQPTAPPVNQNLMELLIILDTLKRASAHRITAVLPYYGYARQDRKDKPRVPITSKLVAILIEKAGANRVLTIDLHAEQIQGFFEIPFDQLLAIPVLADYFLQKKLDNVVIVSPDAGGVSRARAFSNRLKANLAIAFKKREKKNVSEVIDIIGDVEGKNAIILDDMVDTAGTLTNCAEALYNRGAVKIFATATHPVLSGPAIERLQKSVISEVVVTNTIRTNDKSSICPKLKIVSIAPLIGKAIKNIHEETSISTIFH